MKFSVVIPLYNKERFINRCVRSVLNQNFAEFEVLIIDDGSTDGSLGILKKINDPRIKLISQTNAGVSAARNVGIENAQGDWIAFLDADDDWTPHHLSELKKTIDRFPTCSLVSTAFLETTSEEDSQFLVKNTTPIYQLIDYFLAASKKIVVVHSSTAAVRRSSLGNDIRFGPFKIGEDLEFWVRLALEFPVANCSNVTAIYRRGTAGAMETYENSFPPTSYNIDEKFRKTWPQIDLLMKVFEDKNELINSSHINIYINSVILITIKVLLYNERTNEAKAYSKLKYRPITLKNNIVLYLLLLPAWVLHFLVNFLLLLQKLKKPHARI